ncbi:MAG: hypothetical protein IPN76_14205 [Saprospiraceae bacterium]|nr:hypothetical protein [Saprospiraceae bacterium]
MKLESSTKQPSVNFPPNTHCAANITLETQTSKVYIATFVWGTQQKRFFFEGGASQVPK